MTGVACVIWFFIGKLDKIIFVLLCLPAAGMKSASAAAVWGIIAGFIASWAAWGLGAWVAWLMWPEDRIIAYPYILGGWALVRILWSLFFWIFATKKD